MDKTETINGTLYNGDCENVLSMLPDGSVDLIFTSPPYFNARTYSNYETYKEYLDKMERIFIQCGRILRPGRFFIVNSSPVLISRTNRSTASKRLPIPFDLHARASGCLNSKNEPLFEFIEDVVWVKPEGAGWASGRGRRFSADRTPLQYKCVPVTEYLFVYRKNCGKLIDWNIRGADQQNVQDSKIFGEYDVTNVWNIKPSSDSRHPAVFPIDLPKKIIRYYSFKNDVVLDPFGGIGTTGKAAVSMGRKFILIEMQHKYFQIACSDLVDCFNESIKTVES